MQSHLIYRGIAALCLAIIAAGAALPAHAQGKWWNDDWQFRKQIDLNLSPGGADIAGSPVEVPVLIRLHAGNFSYFGDTLPNGADLRFVAADNVTPLKHHIERYDAVNEMAFVWVRVPRLVGGLDTNTVFMYYGNPSAEPGDDAAGTYDANQVLVYHFGEATGAPADATAYGNGPSQFGAAFTEASLIGGGVVFDGSGGITVPDSPSLRVVPDQGMTVSAWVRVAGPQMRGHVVAMQDGTGRGFALGIDGLVPFAEVTSAAGPVRVPGAADLAADQWHHLALRAGDGRVNLFVDGEDVAGMDVDVPQVAAALHVGESPVGDGRFTGSLDELLISNSARSPDWLKAAALGQGMLATLVTYGADAQREAGGHQSYFAITMRNVTVDGWVVVAMLGIMFVVSLVVIVGKAFLLGRVERQNRRFLSAYRRVGTADPLALAKDEDSELPEEEGSAMMEALSGEHYQPSTLFPLYLAGVNEVRHRLQSPAVGAQRRGFSAETIGAIRATVDAMLVRERQKLNRQMVLLTIAISGGPFLGLLGTVVGVMITFAAIAASGDVNVNAIAPGIAAALVATVAGLVVAIPALFAYNWLGSRIRDIDAETHVFADEFVNKLAEHYV